MKCAVIKIVISLIISEICLATGDIGNQLAITDGPSTKIQSCVAKVIERILNPTESLAFLINSHPDYIPSRLPNPVTVMDMRAPLPIHYKGYEVNYVIEAESYALFLQTMKIITKSSLWHPRESPKGKFVILIKEEEALHQMIFIGMWRIVWALHIVVVIYKDTSKNCPMKIITSNPQAEGNNCGRRKPTVFSNFSCDHFSFEFLKPIRNYNGCPVFIQPNRILLELNLNLRDDTAMYNLLAGLKRTLNVTPIYLFGDNEETANEAFQDDEFVMIEGFFGELEHDESSIIFSRKLFYWLGPDPKRISPLKTIFLPFTYDLWIGVLLITILMILIKCMIMKGNGYNNHCVNLACAFTDIIGLTFGVCVNRIPNIWSLKLLLAFLLVYIIHIHTAYTSEIIDILTVPRFEGLIQNVEAVSVSGLSIFMQDYIARIYFQNVTDGDSLLGKINRLIIPYQFDDFHTLNVTNHFHVLDEDEARIPNSESRPNGRCLRKSKHNLFFTNDISGEIKKVFVLRNGSYFTESLNAVITHLWESGAQEADANLNPIPGVPVITKELESVTASASEAAYSLDNSVRPLHLTDLLPIFVILLAFLSFCVIIFVAEILIHKIVAHITRNQVVPLPTLNV